MVSLRLTTTSIVEKPTLASRGFTGSATGAAGKASGTARGGCARGRIARTPAIANSPNCSTQALLVDSPGIADLMKIGTIYTT
jgi:hypothetical protein